MKWLKGRKGSSGITANIPLLKTLDVCTNASKRSARTELYWTVGFALLAVPIVLFIVLFTRPPAEIPAQIFEVIGRGELMVYAATVCGTALYSLRHGIDAIPSAIKSRITPKGTLSVVISLLLAIAVISYVVRRMADINKMSLNEGLLNAVSFFVLAASLTLAYIVLSLKYALQSGAATASHEQTADFGVEWEAQRES